MHFTRQDIPGRRSKPTGVGGWSQSVGLRLLSDNLVQARSAAARTATRLQVYPVHEQMAAQRLVIDLIKHIQMPLPAGCPCAPAGKVVSAAAGPVADAAQQLKWEGDAAFELLGTQGGWW